MTTINGCGHEFDPEEVRRKIIETMDLPFASPGNSVHKQRQLVGDSVSSKCLLGTLRPIKRVVKVVKAHWIRA